MLGRVRGSSSAIWHKISQLQGKTCKRDIDFHLILNSGTKPIQFDWSTTYYNLQDTMIQCWMVRWWSYWIFLLCILSISPQVLGNRFAFCCVCGSVLVWFTHIFLGCFTDTRAFMRLDLSHRVGESCYVSTDQYLLFGQLLHSVHSNKNSKPMHYWTFNSLSAGNT